jgi:hypothetical protein
VTSARRISTPFVGLSFASLDSSVVLSFVTHVKVGRMLRRPGYNTLSPLLITVSPNSIPFHLRNSRRSVGITYILSDVKEVLKFHQDHGADRPRWERYVESRCQLIDETMPERRVKTRGIKHWMIKHRLLKDTHDFYYP